MDAWPLVDDAAFTESMSASSAQSGHHLPRTTMDKAYTFSSPAGCSVPWKSCPSALSFLSMAMPSLRAA